jgi:hypothetical protein
VLDRRAPFRRLTVEVEGSSGTRVSVLADRYRADLHQAGLGDGYSGFSVPLQCLGNSGPVRVSCIDPAVELGAIDLSRPASATAPLPMVFAQGPCLLAIDMPPGPRHISGWAADRACSTSRRVLRLRGDGRILAEQRATLFRPEAAQAPRDGYHGFWFSVPAARPTKLVLEDIEAGLAFPVRL